MSPRAAAQAQAQAQAQPGANAAAIAAMTASTGPPSWNPVRMAWTSRSATNTSSAARPDPTGPPSWKRAKAACDTTVRDQYVKRGEDRSDRPTILELRDKRLGHLQGRDHSASAARTDPTGPPSWNAVRAADTTGSATNSSSAARTDPTGPPPWKFARAADTTGSATNSSTAAMTDPTGPPSWNFATSGLQHLFGDQFVKRGDDRSYRPTILEIRRAADNAGSATNSSAIRGEDRIHRPTLLERQESGRELLQRERV